MTTSPPRITVPQRCRCGRWFVPQSRAPIFPRSPRRAPYWPSPIRAINANSGVVITTEGIGITSDGIAIASTTSGTCGCCASGVPCGACPGGTPALLDVAIADVDLVTACFGDGGKITTGSVFSDVFTGLTQFPGFPCIYRKQQAYSSVIASFWTDTICAGSPDDVTDKIQITASISGGVGGPYIGIDAILYVDTPSGPDAEIGVAQLFTSGFHAGSCATGWVSAPNSLTSSAGTFIGEKQYEMGYDGFASASPG